MSKLAEKTPEGAPVEDASVLEDERPESLWRRLSPEARLLALMVGLAAGVFTLLGLANDIPQIYPDEFLYQGLAESLVDGGGLTIRGESPDLFGVLYVLAVAPAWLLASGGEAYAAAKLLNAVYLSLTAVPVWLLARDLTGAPRRALVPAALTLVGSWMLFSHQIVTENVALPLATAALASMVAALRRPGSRWWLAAAGFVALAALARTHMLALAVVLAVVPLLDGLRQPAGQRLARLRSHGRWIAVVGSASAVAAAIVVATDLSVLGRYESLADVRGRLGTTLEWGAYHALAVALMSGVVPLVAALAIAARSRNWRDDQAGPLLVVIGAAAAVLIGLAGWFVGAEVRWLIERYVVYLLPLLLVALVVTPGRVSRRSAVAAALLLALALVGTREAEELAEGKAVSAAIDLARGIGVFGDVPELGVALFALLVGVGGALLVSLDRPLLPVARPLPSRARRTPAARRAAAPATRALKVRAAFAAADSGFVAAVTLTAVVLVSGTAWAAHLHADRYGPERGNLPEDLEWVDHSASGTEVALVALEPRSSNISEVTAFYNRKIDSAYHLGGLEIRDLARNCQLTIARDGTLGAAAPCGAPPRELLFEDAAARAHLHRETSREVTVYAGTLVRTAEERPRLMSIVIPPCNETFQRCRPYLRMHVWLDRPETVVLRFLGGPAQESLALPNGQTFALEPNALSKITLDVPAGEHDLRLPVSWRALDGPQLESVVLVRPDGDLTIY